MRPRFTYANVVSTLALVVALSGGIAYAATTLPDNSVGQFQLRTGAVTAQKIRKNAVTAPKIKAEAIKQGKIANGSITAAKMTGGSVSNGSLQDGSVTNSKLGPDSVSGDKVNESTLSEVPSAARAAFATEAESASPPAFAAVSSEATIDSSYSEGIAQVREGSLAGIYCITAQGFNPRGAQVSARFNVSGQITAYLRIGGTADCPAPQVEVQTFDGGVRTREPFYLALWR
jgi:hypothetical protein